MTAPTPASTPRRQFITSLAAIAGSAAVPAWAEKLQAIGAPQRFDYGGRSWKITLRAKRIYEPFSLTLLKFSHDRYAGTDIPKNFSSRVKIKSPDGRDDREALIYMNNPLRYAGLTFYQSGFERGFELRALVVRRGGGLVSVRGHGHSVPPGHRSRGGGDGI